MAEVRVTRRFEAPPHKVFDAWLDPAKARRFLFATPDGEMVRCDIDARVGGRFTLIDRRPEVGDAEHVGQYEVIERPSLLVFTFAVPQYDPGVTRVRVEIGPDGAGSMLTLIHEGVLPDWEAQTQQGWGMILESLEQVLA